MVLEFTAEVGQHIILIGRKKKLFELILEIFQKYTMKLASTVP